MSRKRLSVGLAAYGLDKVVVAVAQLFTIPVLVNAWGLEPFGVWAMLTTVPAFLVLTDFGIVNSAWARMVDFAAREEWERAESTFHTAWLSTGLIVAVALAAAVAVVLALPAGTFPSTHGMDEHGYRLTLILLLIYGLLAIVSRLNAAAFRASMLYTFATLFGTALFGIENGAVLIVAALGYDPVVAAATMLGLRIAGVAVLLVCTIVRLPRLRPGVRRASRAEWSAMWRPALAASALGFGLAGYLQGSVLLLGAIGGAAAVPAFVAVRTLSRLGVQFSTFIATPVSQEFGNAMGKGQLARAGRLFGLVLGIAIITAAVAGLGLVLLGQPLVAFWTQGKIHADATLLAFMAVSSVAAMLWNPLSNFILALNRQQSYSYANVVVSAVGMLLIYLAAHRMGAAAAGLSFALVDAVTLGAVLLFIHRHWSHLPEFRQGVALSFHELTHPAAALRALRGTPARAQP